MAKGRELKGRIRSIENTRKITRTMEMVATSKMKRAQDRVVAARPYAGALAEVIASLYSPDLAESFPLLRQPAEVKRAVVGYGRAEKHQVQHMVKLILGLDEAPTPHDASDALAVAICHSHSLGPVGTVATKTSKSRAETSWRHYRPARP